MPSNEAVLQRTILRLLKSSETDSRLGNGRFGLAEAVEAQFPENRRPDPGEIMAAVWALVGQGLAYIDYSATNPANWTVLASRAGLTADHLGSPSASDPEAFLEWLSEAVPLASSAVFEYASEALICQNNRCYFACSVMVALAAEAAFLELASSFSRALPDGQKQIFSQVITNPRTMPSTKFAEFKKRMEPFRSDIPSDISDGLTMTLDGLLGLIQSYRDDASHPMVRKIAPDDALINLQMFSRYIRKVYALREFFNSTDLVLEE